MKRADMVTMAFLSGLFAITNPCIGQDVMHPEPPTFSPVEQQPRGRVYKDRIDPHWFKSDPSLAQADRFWYRNELPENRREFVLVIPSESKKVPAFDHAKVADALSKALSKDVTADHLPVETIAFRPEGIDMRADGKGWRFDPAKGTIEQGDQFQVAVTAPQDAPRGGRRRGPMGGQGSPRSSRSPDGVWEAFVKDHNVFVRKSQGGRDWQLSTDGTDGDSYEGGVFWSPDSTRLVALRTAKSQEHPVTMVQSSPRDQVQPKLVKHQYLKPGDKIAVTKPHLFDVAAKEEIPVKDELFPNPWSVGDFRWAADSSRFTFLYNERGHQKLRLIALDARTGAASAIIDEQSKTFIDYSNKTFLRFVDRDSSIVWMSERDGWNHLYQIDAKTGEVRNPITKGEWVVRGVEQIDDAAGTVDFQAMGIDPKQDPYHVHHARVKLDGTGLTLLTEGDGTHNVSYSPDRKFLIDSYSRVDLAPVTELRRAEDGKLVVPLETADVSSLESAGWKAPERFSAKGRDGKTDIFGLIIRPTKFDPKGKYPVIEQIYAGPHGAHVPKAFSPGRGLQDLADLGFVIVQIDGMGTNWRSKAFHDVCWKNLKDAGFPDRIAWMKKAAETRPEMDLSKVGIYGGSAGGQNAMAALLFHGDFYKAAVADCGCHDNRMDKIWWNEAWMGWPLDKSYEESSNVANAGKITGKLMLTVGELDRNVDPASTMQVVDALIRAGKDFELIVFPGADHGAGGSPYGRRRMREFFVRHLLGTN